MERTILNRTLLENNDCFGCGHENQNGYKIDVWAEDGVRDELFGVFHPPRHAIGFPGVTHGGAIYTVFDCIAAWVPSYFRPEMKAIWMLKKAEMEYRRPSIQGDEIRLKATIAEEGEKWTPMTVEANALNVSGDLLAVGTYTFVPLSAERFKFVSGLSELPANWDKFLRGDRRPLD